MTDKTKYKSVAIDNNCYKKIEELTTELTPGIKLSRAEVVRFLVNNFKFVEEEKDHYHHNGSLN